MCIYIHITVDKEVSYRPSADPANDIEKKHNALLSTSIGLGALCSLSHLIA